MGFTRNKIQNLIKGSIDIIDVLKANVNQDALQSNLRLVNEQILIISILRNELSKIDNDVDEIELDEIELSSRVRNLSQREYIKEEILDLGVVTNILNDIESPKKDSAEFIRIGELIDSMEKKINDPNENNPEAFFNSKHDNRELNEEELEEKEKFLNFVKINESIRYANPKKAASLNDLYTLFIKDERNIHEEAIEEKRIIDSASNPIFDDDTVKDYLRNIYMYNFSGEVDDEKEKQKFEKATVLLSGNTEDAYLFQRDFIREMINKMLALPDEKLALSSGEEARKFYTENIKTICMLRETEKLFNLPAFNMGRGEDYSINKDLVNIVNHKRKLALQNIYKVEKEINYLANEKYKELELFNRLSTEEQKTSLKGKGEFELPEYFKESAISISNVEEDIITEKVESDTYYDNKYANFSDVSIRATTSYGKIEAILTELDRANRNESINGSQEFINFNERIRNLGTEIRNEISFENQIKLYEKVREEAEKLYTSKIPYSGFDVNKIKEEDKTLVGLATSIMKECDFAIKVTEFNKNDQREEKSLLEEFYDLANGALNFKESLNGKSKETDDILKELTARSNLLIDDLIGKEKVYGKCGITSTNIKGTVGKIMRLIDDWKTLPRDLLESTYNEDSAINSTYQKIWDFMQNLQPTEEYVAQMIKENYPNIARNNMEYFRAKLKEYECSNILSDDEIVSYFVDYLNENIPKDGEDILDSVTKYIVYKDRSVEDEIRYNEKLLRGLKSSELNEEVRNKILSSIGRIEFLKGKKDGNYVIESSDNLDRDVRDFLFDKTNLILNCTYGNAIVEKYLENPNSIFDHYEHVHDTSYLDVPKEEYKNRFKEIIRSKGIDVKLLDNVQIGEFDETKKLAMGIYRDGELGGKINKVYGPFFKDNNKTRNWDRMLRYCLKIPRSTQDDIDNLEFLKKFNKNEKDNEGRTFRQKLLLDIKDKLYSLNHEDVYDFTIEKFYKEYEKNIKTWGFAYVAGGDFVGACMDEGILLDEEDKVRLQNIMEVGNILWSKAIDFTKAYSHPYYDLVKGNDELYKEVTTKINVGDVPEKDFFVNLREEKRRKEIYDLAQKKDKAIEKAGIFKIPNLSKYTVCYYDEDSTYTKKTANYLQTVLNDNDVVAIVNEKDIDANSIGFEQIVFGYNKESNTFVTGHTFDEVQRKIKSYDYIIPLESFEEHTTEEYEEALNKSNEEITEKIKYSEPLEKWYVARYLATRKIKATLDELKVAGLREEYKNMLKNLLDETRMIQETSSIYASPKFNSFIEKNFTIDPDTNLVITRPNENELNGSSIYEDFIKMPVDPLEENEKSWNKPLTQDESFSLAETLIKEVSSLDIGRIGNKEQEENASAAIEDLFKLAFINDIIAEGKEMSLKELNEKARYYAHNREAHNVAATLINKSSLSELCKNISGNKGGQIIDKISRGLKIIEEKKSDNYVSPEMYFMDHVKGEYKDEDLESFKNLCDFNEKIAYVNPDHKKTYEELFNLQFNEELKNRNEKYKALKKSNDEWIRRIKDGHSKDLFSRSYYVLFSKGELKGLEKIKYEKAHYLLNGETKEDLEYQKEIASEMINRMISIPDEKLNLLGTPEAEEYLMEHYGDVLLLFEAPHLTDQDYKGGIFDYFDVPDEIKNIIKHKSRLAQSRLWRESALIDMYGSDTYKEIELLKGCSNNELLELKELVGDLYIGSKNSSIVSGYLTTNDGDESYFEGEELDSTMDGFYLNPNEVKINEEKIRADKSKTLKDMFDSLNNKVLKTNIIDYEVRKLGMDLSIYSDEIGTENENNIYYYEALRDRLNQFLEVKLSDRKNVNSLSKAEKNAVENVQEFVDFTKEKIRVLTHKENVKKEEEALGIKENILDEFFTVARNLEKEDFVSVIATVPADYKNDVESFKTDDAEFLGHLDVYKAKYGGNNVCIEKSGQIIHELKPFIENIGKYPKNITSKIGHKAFSENFKKLIEISSRLPKTEEELFKLFDERTTKTLYENIGNFRNVLKLNGYKKKVTDEELVEHIHNRLRESKGKNLEINTILKEFSYKDRTIEEEVEFKREKLRSFKGKELSKDDWIEVAKLATFIEAMKGKEGLLPSHEEVNNEVRKYFNGKEDFILNIASKDEKTLDTLINNPDSLYKKFEYKEKEFVMPDLNANFKEYRKALEDNDIDVSNLPEEYRDIPFEKQKYKAIKVIDDYNRMTKYENVSSFFADVFEYKVEQGTGRTPVLFLKLPNCEENIRYNYEFAKNWNENPKSDNDISFREKVLRDKFETLKHLDGKEFLNISKEEMVDKYEDLLKDWQAAYDSNDILNTFVANGIELNEEDKAQIDVIKHKGTIIFRGIDMIVRKYGSPNEYIYDQLKTDKAIGKDIDTGFDKYFHGDCVEGDDALKNYEKDCERYAAIDRAGLFNMPNISKLTYVDLDNNMEENQFASIIPAMMKKEGPFALKDENGEMTYYRYDHKGKALVSASSLKELNVKSMEFDVSIKLDTNGNYNLDDYKAILEVSHTKVESKMLVTGVTETKDFARKLVLESLIANISNEKYEGMYDAIVNEEFINDSVDILMGSDSFKKLTNSIGGEYSGYLNNPITENDLNEKHYLTDLLRFQHEEMAERARLEEIFSNAFVLREKEVKERKHLEKINNYVSLSPKKKKEFAEMSTVFIPEAENSVTGEFDSDYVDTTYIFYKAGLLKNMNQYIDEKKVANYYSIKMEADALKYQTLNDEGKKAFVEKFQNNIYAKDVEDLAIRLLEDDRKKKNEKFITLDVEKKKYNSLSPKDKSKYLEERFNVSNFNDSYKKYNEGKLKDDELLDFESCKEFKMEADLAALKKINVKDKEALKKIEREIGNSDYLLEVHELDIKKKASEREIIQEVNLGDENNPRFRQERIIVTDEEEINLSN